jgi:6-phosphofructokinase 2
MKRIITLTINPCIDKSSAVDRVVPERKLRCKPPTYEPGGGGINVSKAIAKLGGSSVALCAAGGATGKMLDRMLKEECIRHHVVPIAGATRENLIVFEESTTLQYRFGMPGPEMSEKECQQLLDRLSNVKPKPDYIVASGSLPGGVGTDFYARVARVGRELDSRVVVDTSREPLRLAVAEGVYLIKPNLDELAEIAGRKVTHDPEMLEAARHLVGKGHAQIVVISLGAAGALLVWGEGHARIPAPTVPIRSKVGAGDSMVAGMIMSLAKGKRLEEAVRYGVAAGSAAVMTAGTQLCRREDTEQLYKHMLAGKP